MRHRCWPTPNTSRSRCRNVFPSWRREGQMRCPTLCFRAPSQDVISVWTLATSHAELDGESVLHAHVVIMPHVTQDILDQFVIDLALDTTTSKVSTQDSLTADASVDDVILGTASDPFATDLVYDCAASEISTTCDFLCSTEADEDRMHEFHDVSEHTNAKMPHELDNGAKTLF